MLLFNSILRKKCLFLSILSLFSGSRCVFPCVFCTFFLYLKRNQQEKDSEVTQEYLNLSLNSMTIMRKGEIRCENSAENVILCLRPRFKRKNRAR